MNRRARTFKQLLIHPPLPDPIPHIFQPTQISPLILPSLPPPILPLPIPPTTLPPISSLPILFPLLQTIHLNFSLLLLPIPPRTLFSSHLNHPPFSIFKHYFPLTIKHTFLICSLLQSLISLLALALLLILNMLIS
ncbi:GntT/GntP/DsdX family permease, partial [Staphylococcus auricularis]